MIIVDDGGSDQTKEVIEGFEDHRLKYFWKENGERARARNFGAQLAKGKWLTFHDSDDILYSTHLQTAHDFLSSNSESKFIATGREQVNNELQVIPKSQILKTGNVNRKLIHGNFLSCLGVFVRSSIFEKYQFSEDETILLSEDWHLWLRLAAAHPLLMIPQITCALRVHESRSVSSVNKPTLIQRKVRLLQVLDEDPEVKQWMGADWRHFASSNYSYLALHLLLGKAEKQTLFKASQDQLEN